MSFPGFEYLGWVRQKQRAARFPLTFSGVTPPPASLFRGQESDLSLDTPNVYGAFVDAIAKTFQIPACSVFPCTGTSGGVFVILAALLEAGDTIVVEYPTYELLLDVPAALGARIVRLPRRFEDGFTVLQEDIDKALQEKPKVLLLANPHNPSGRVLSQEELRSIIGRAREVGCEVVVDEVYLPFSNEASAFHLGAITVSSPTKVSGLGDLRTGWVFAPPRLMEKLQAAADLSGGYLSVVSAQLMTRALSRWGALVNRGRAFQDENLPIVKDFIASQGDLSWVVPDVGLVGFVRLTGTDNAEPFINYALAEHEVGLVPGRFFGDAGGFRLGFGQPKELLEEALRRLDAALRGWKSA